MQRFILAALACVAMAGCGAELKNHRLMWMQDRFPNHEVRALPGRHDEYVMRDSAGAVWFYYASGNIDEGALTLLHDAPPKSIVIHQRDTVTR